MGGKKKLWDFSCFIRLNASLFVKQKRIDEKTI